MHSSVLLYTEKVRNVYRWISFVEICLQPFATFQGLEHWKHVKYGSISLKTFKHYMALFMLEAEKLLRLFYHTMSQLYLEVKLRQTLTTLKCSRPSPPLQLKDLIQFALLYHPTKMSLRRMQMSILDF